MAVTASSDALLIIGNKKSDNQLHERGASMSKLTDCTAVALESALMWEAEPNGRPDARCRIPSPSWLSGFARRWRSAFSMPVGASFADLGFPTGKAEIRRRMDEVARVFLAGFNRGLVEDDYPALMELVAASISIGGASRSRASPWERRPPMR